MVCLLFANNFTGKTLFNSCTINLSACDPMKLKQLSAIGCVKPIEQVRGSCSPAGFEGGAPTNLFGKDPTQAVGIEQFSRWKGVWASSRLLQPTEISYLANGTDRSQISPS